jgi:hypothetical protein
VRVVWRILHLRGLWFGEPHPAERLGGEGCHEVTAWAIRLSCEFDGGDVLRSKPLNVLQVDADRGCCDVGRG